MRTKAMAFLLMTLLFKLTPAHAQLLFRPNAAIQQPLRQVVNDFSNHLQNITGALIQDNVESSDYSSKVNLPGTESCTITAYKSKKDKNRSWQAVFPEAESFSAAKKQYRELFLQIKNMQVRVPGNDKGVNAKGNYDEPKEEKKFAGSIFRFASEDELYKDVKIEVSLHYIITGWQVSVYVYDKKEDDEIQPDPDANAGN
ncbi:hypothetical protein [Ferruginibacter sp.]